MSDSKPPHVHAPNCVTIFGGGVAGLSAAHELIERQFRVQVWEPQTDERYPDGGCDVGGMARTQWARVAWPATPANLSHRTNASDWSGSQTSEIVVLPQTFYVKTANAKTSRIYAFDAGGQLTAKGCSEAVDSMLKTLEDTPRIDFVYCEVQRRLDGSDGLTPEAVEKAASYFREVIGKAKSKRALKAVKRDPALPWQRTLKLELRDREVSFAVTPIDGFPEGVPDAYSIRIGFRVRERWLPGEHGFRFFPSFYHHLFDTMKRTPILEPAPKSPIGAAQERSVSVNANPQKYLQTGRTAYDNLLPTTKIALGMSRDSRPSVESRSAPASLEDVRQWLRLFFSSPGSRPSTARKKHGIGDGETGGGFGCTARDAARFQLKVLKYLTSCERRRQEYEHMNWFEFLGGEEDYSPEFVDMTNKWPEALIAMDAKQIDARSHGSVLMQFILDNVRPPGYRDGTLSGPTSEAWLQHWRRYLEAQGVEFIHGKLEGLMTLKSTTGTGVIWPKVQCYEPRYPMNADGQPDLMPGYFVLALPVIEAQKIAKEYVRGRGAELGAESNFKRLSEMPLPADLMAPIPDGPLRHMIGIQYYFDEDLSWFDGHIYFPRSKWGISGISQIHFWQDRPDWESGYRGILSVIFSMAIDGQPNTAAWTSQPADLVKEVWNQIREDLPNLPEPRHWHLDGNVSFKSKKMGYTNSSPYLINPPNEWAKRPGQLELPDATKKVRCGYQVEDGFVLAGTYMKTFTRLTTMEAANESARHAVNGILWDFGHSMATSYCDIWPLEDREVDDFRILKDLDEELYERGLDHFTDILDLDELAARALRGGSRDPFDGLGVLDGIRRLLEQHGPAVIDALGSQRTGDGR